MRVNEWFSAAELAALNCVDLPDVRAIQERANRENWRLPEREGINWRERQGRGGGYEYHARVLPMQAQLAITLAGCPSAANDRTPADAEAASREGLWEWFYRLPGKKQQVARERLHIIQAIESGIHAGHDCDAVMREVSLLTKHSVSTLYNWRKLIAAAPEHDRLPYLAPKHAGRTEAATCSVEAWDFVRADYLRLEQPTFRACYRRLERAARANGWTIPCERTLLRRIEALGTPALIAARKGKDALKRMYPAQRRDHAALHALEAVNADGHKFDLWVRWADGVISRPILVAFQDVFSGKMLSYRIDRTENKEAIRLAFGDMIEAFGIPDHAILDNGRGFTSKMLSGGTPNRYRFKIRDEDPQGILVAMGVKVHWSTPFAGQSKPIERAFRDFAGDVAKHPAFAGAYTGNTPLAKPENYGSRAIDVDVFERVLAGEWAAHNARAGRTSPVCAGRSFDEAFNESYARSPIRKASPGQRLMWLLAAEQVLVSRTDSSITLMGNRYWSEALASLGGTRVTVRFDPQALHDDLHVYRTDNSYLGAAPCIHAVGFLDVDAARAHNGERKRWMRGAKMQADAERRMSIAQVAAMLPDAAPPEPAPASKVVRLFRGSAALAARPDELTEDEAAEMYARGADVVFADQRRAARDEMRRLKLIEGGDD